MFKRIVSSFAKLAFTAALFVALFRPETYGLRPDLFGGVTPLKMIQELGQVSATNAAVWLTFAVVVKLAGMMAGVLRWRLLLRGQGLNMPFWYMVQSWFVGRFFGIFLPGTIGLDGYRLIDSSIYTKDVIKSATVIAVEKLIGFISLTFLVFLTFPLGFRLLSIKVPMLLGILVVLGTFVVVSFLLLLNPRVIQILVAVVPTPPAIRNKIDKLGASITAYSGSRKMLLLAVFFGFLVHFATCITYFGTMMAIKAPNTNILDILFASPLMIYGTVLGPSIGGEGIREIVFASILGGKSGVVTAVLFAHLGWWVGDFVPFLIGAPIVILRSRPGRRELEAQVAAARREAAEHDAKVLIHLEPSAVAFYREKLIDFVLAGIGAGLVAGAVIGLIEAEWIRRTLQGLSELSAFWWGPLVYGPVFVCVALGIAGALAFLCLLLDRFPRNSIVAGLCFGGTLASGGVVAVFRFGRDVLAGHPPSITQLAGLLGGSLGIGLIAGVIVIAIGWVIPRKRIVVCGFAVAVYVALIAGGGIVAVKRAPAPAGTSFAPQTTSTGPNVIFVVADALRADYLKLYSSQAVANSPQLDAFSGDAVNFQNCFAQAAWTKPGFATIFSGLYPECHTATTKVSMLPKEITTFPEIFETGGYYTKGFANNPNIAGAFDFSQGFVDYVDLKPRLYFAAKYSSSKLALYEVLRRARNIFMSKISKKMVVTDFYQPADVVTKEALTWLDSPQRPKNAPFFLFLHYMDPHDPFMDHSKPGIGYARVRMENPDPTKFLEPMKQAYNSEIEYMDKHLGALFDGLRQRGLYDDSVIVFTADHGEEFFDHKGWWHGQTLFDELIHIPLLFKLPKQAKAGETNAAFARQIDLGPTLLQFAGLKQAEEMPGKPLFGADGNYANSDLSFVYAENDFENNILQSVRTHDTKMIHANEDNPRKHAPKELYDLKQDPKEQSNLVGKGNPQEAELENLVTDMKAKAADCSTASASVSSFSSDQKEQLESLGYLGDK